MVNLLAIQKSRKVEALRHVREFLESISRNSIKSKRSYSSAITLLQDFLEYKHDQEGQQKSKYQGYSCETILQPLKENSLNVYEDIHF